MGQEYNQTPLIHHGALGETLLTLLPHPQQVLSNTFLGLSFCLLHGLAQKLMQFVLQRDFYISILLYQQFQIQGLSKKQKQKQNKSAHTNHQYFNFEQYQWFIPS
jgi:hypothetical protein